MGALTIRNLDDRIIAAIKRRAAANDVSMEEEIRRLLASAYDDDQRARGREWAQRQLERLRCGELPKGDDSVALIRSMRRERTNQLMRAIEGPRGRRR